MPPVAGQEWTLVGALVAAVVALFTVNKVYFGVIIASKDAQIAAKDLVIADYKARLDRKDALIERMAEATRVAVGAAEKAVGAEKVGA